MLLAIVNALLRAPFDALLAVIREFVAEWRRAWATVRDDADVSFGWGKRAKVEA